MQPGSSVPAAVTVSEEAEPDGSPSESERTSPSPEPGLHTPVWIFMLFTCFNQVLHKISQH